MMDMIHREEVVNKRVQNKQKKELSRMVKNHELLMKLQLNQLKKKYLMMEKLL